MSSNILSYNVTVYKQIYSIEFMSSFTHDSLAKGQIDRSVAGELVIELNSCAQKLMPCISFNPEMLSGEQLDGGACSAISFRVSKKALSLIRNLQENSNLKPSSMETAFACGIMRFINEFEGLATSNKKSDKLSQKAIRTEQMAFNTITVDRSLKYKGNAISEKVSAIAPFYGLKVVESTTELKVKDNNQLESQLIEKIQQLKEGVYILRIIQEEKNHKLEEKGHTIVFIKKTDAEYYFDPALGCYTLFSELNKTNLIYNALISANKHFGVSVLSFHRLEEENQILSQPLEVDKLGLKGAVLNLSKGDNNPVIIFSPGLGLSVQAYKSMLEGMCAKKFTIVSVDHPETGVGTAKLDEQEIIKCGRNNGINIQKLVRMIREGCFPNIYSTVPIAVMGHSLGGYASIEACGECPDIFAAVNFDGRVPRVIKQPVLQFVAMHTNEDRKSYVEALSELLKANPLVAEIKVDAKHGDFSSLKFDLEEKIIKASAVFLNKYLEQGTKL